MSIKLFVFQKSNIKVQYDETGTAFKCNLPDYIDKTILLELIVDKLVYKQLYHCLARISSQRTSSPPPALSSKEKKRE